MDVKAPSPRYAFKAGKALTSNLPVDWQLTRVEDAGAVLGGRQRSPSAQGEPTPYLRVANVFAGWIDTSDVLQMPFTADERARFSLRAGDILLNEGQSLELVGRSAIYRDEPPNCCFQNTLVRFRAGPRTDPNYAQYVFESYLRRGEFSKIALQTTSIAHLGAGRFAQMPFVAPPLAEQKAIGQALSDADTLIDSLEQLLAKKRQIKQGAMQELLTGKRRLPGFEQRWNEVKVRQLGTFLKGSGIKREEALSGDLPCVRYGELYTTHSDHVRSFSSWISPAVASSATLLRNGDLLFAGSGETKEEIGKCAAFLDAGPAYAGGDIVILRPTVDADSMFLGYLLNTPSVVRQKASKGQGDAVVHISANALGEVEVMLPQPPEQAAIARVLFDMDTELAAIKSRLTKARALKQAMAQALLTGRIRLVEPTA